MPPKKGKSKITFQIFSTTNYSKFASRFPFLKERQIKAKLLQAWRNTFTSETTKDLKGNIKKTKHRNETPLNGAESDAPAVAKKMLLKRDLNVPPLVHTLADVTPLKREMASPRKKQLKQDV
ncbi:hypothetical protein OS493_013235 [Desmophyllum pertusum]|uniref:Uncharacterized protein n=1 Tax=Desmophyllum pertusum TaxID=174260 RepID=A0A9W9YRL7_9CNID|nr:hypothetical protein OS493_013235 [Desmophyllum pertusum]